MGAKLRAVEKEGYLHVVAAGHQQGAVACARVVSGAIARLHWCVHVSPSLDNNDIHKALLRREAKSHNTTIVITSTFAFAVQFVLQELFQQ